MGKFLGRFIVPGGEVADRASSAVENLLVVGLHLGDNGKGEGGVPDDGGVHSETTKHGRILHFCMITSRPVWGSGEVNRDMGGYAVV